MADKGSMQQSTKKSVPAAAATLAATIGKAEPKIQKAGDQSRDSSATTSGSNVPSKEGEHDAPSASATMSCDRLMDEIVAAACATTSAAARTSVIGGREGLDNMADVVTRSRVPMDASEFQAVGLDERRWSDRHSAFMFLCLFRGLS